MAVVREDVAKISFDIGWEDLTRLTDALDEIKSMLSGGVGEDAFDEMIKESKKATEGVEDVKQVIKGVKPDGINDTADGLNETAKQAEKADSKLKSFGKTVGKVALMGAKFLATGLAAGVAGVGAMVTQSVSEFADYQQLIGGVETLFKNSAGVVEDYARNAFKTAGLSANDYMETVTSFSASLIQSLGGDTKKASEKAHTAIVDMSDNANKMGTDMSMLQNAYQGFAKQNYTMLDNLKLGYGGTKEEMQRLIQDAEKLSGMDFDISSYADIVDAIHIIQENMGITGTTAKEAEGTISGSLASLKGAWKNTLTALVSGGDDFDKCVDNLVSSAKTFAKNILPAVISALGGVGDLIEELAPVIEAELPTLVDTLLPPLLKAATALIKGLIVALPDILRTLVKMLPDMLDEIWQSVEDILGEKNAGFIKKLIPMALGLVAAFKMFPMLKSLFSGLFGGKDGGASTKASGGLFGSFTQLANMKPTVILKGIGNLAIILGGLTVLAAAFAFVAPYIASLSDIGSLAETFAIVAVLGVAGALLAKAAGAVGAIPVSNVALGLANMAIIIAGLAVLAGAFALAAPYIADLSDSDSLLELITIMTALGVFGTVMSIFAGIVGLIPIPVVLMGLANIALVIAGFTALVAAYGALSSIPGFDDFMSKGGDTLANVIGQVGKIAGSLVGNFGEALSNSLPKIGENLAAFGDSIAPMLQAFSGVDVSGVGDFLLALSAFVALMTGEKLLSFITGGPNYAKLGTQLSDFANNATDFFTIVATYPEAGFTNATALFQSLSDIGNLPNTGGIAQWFSGKNDFNALAEGLEALSGDGVIAFFTAVAQIPEIAFANTKALFESFADISNIPNTGGVAQWFSGENDISKLGSQLKSFGEKAMPFFAEVSNIDISKVGEMWKVIEKAGDVAVNDLSGLASKGTELTKFMDNVKGFFDGTVAIVTSGTARITGIVASVNLYSEGTDIMRGLNYGMRSQLPSIISTALTAARLIKSTIDDALGINSPAKELIVRGEYAGEGQAIGMMNAIPKIEEAAFSMSMAAMPFDSYSPESSTVYGGNTSEHTTIAPVFNLTISGSSDDRALARRVKRYVSEAIEETFESLERKSYSMREA